MVVARKYFATRQQQRLISICFAAPSGVSFFHQLPLLVTAEVDSQRAIAPLQLFFT